MKGIDMDNYQNQNSDETAPAQSQPPITQQPPFMSTTTVSEQPSSQQQIYTEHMAAESKDGKEKKLPTIVIVLMIIVCGLICGAIVFAVITLGNQSGKNDTDAYNKELQEQIVNTENEDIKPNAIAKYDDIYGRWLTGGGTLFEFDELGDFYWWKEKSNLSDNYWSGTYEIYQSLDAIKKIADETNQEFLDLELRVIENLNRIKSTQQNDEKEVTIDDYYTIYLYPTELISEGVDKSSELGSRLPDGYILLTFVVTGDKQAQAYNYSMGDTYYLQKDN